MTLDYSKMRQCECGEFTYGETQCGPCRLRKENKILKERVKKFREIISEFSLPIYTDSNLQSLFETLNSVAKIALSRDDEMERKGK
jgi:hypothetical protein